MKGNTILSIVFGLLLAFFITAVLTGMKIPFASGGKESIIALAVLGLVACGAAGIGHSVSKFGFTNPITIIGGVLGVVALLPVILILTGVNIPLIEGYKMAFSVLAGILLLLVVLKIVQNRIWT